MSIATGALIAGLLLIFMALGSTVLARLPLSTSMLYVGAGVLLSPWGLGLLQLNIVEHTWLLERTAEVVLLLSLFTAGLKLSPGLRDRTWLLPLRLAVTSMIVTAFAIAAVAHLFLKLPLGVAILLGGILAPTDPVLAADVQVTHPRDRDRLRFALTGEGGLNDGTAMPIVLLGMGLLGARNLGEGGARWLLVDTIWACLGGLAIGALLGLAVGRLVLYLRREHKEAVGLDDFLALGLIALTYGAALVSQANGFLAVFAAGVALRRLEQTQRIGEETERDVERAVEKAAAHPDASVADAIAVDAQHAPAYMARAVLGFNQQVERIGEVAVVVMIGALLWTLAWEQAAWWFVAVLLLVIRPASVMIGLARSPSSAPQRWLIGWFGIRGVGSLYYLMYAINRGLPSEHVAQVGALTLSVIVASVIVHGISVTPLMTAYEKAMKGRTAKPSRTR